MIAGDRGKFPFYYPDAPCISMYGIFTYIWLQYMVASGFYQNENTLCRGIISHSPTENRKGRHAKPVIKPQLNLPKANPPTQIERAKVRKLKDHLEDDVHCILMGPQQLGDADLVDLALNHSQTLETNI